MIMSQDPPDQIPPDANKHQVRNLVRSLRDYIVGSSTSPHSLPLQSTSQYTIGEVRPFRLTTLFVEVWDGHGWQVMKKDYYEKTYGSQAVLPTHSGDDGITDRGRTDELLDTPPQSE